MPDAATPSANAAMKPFRHLLVARDFSPGSERALAAGLDLAARTGATLHLVHAEVLHGDPYGGTRTARPLSRPGRSTSSGSG